MTLAWWHELRSSETRVRLPSAFTEHSVTFMGDDRRVPVESIGSERWVAGSPSSTGEPPVELVISLDGGVMSPGLRFCWSLWTDTGAPGRTMVEEVSARLAAMGWDDLGFETENVLPPEARA